MTTYFPRTLGLFILGSPVEQFDSIARHQTKYCESQSLSESRCKKNKEKRGRRSKNTLIIYIYIKKYTKLNII